MERQDIERKTIRSKALKTDEAQGIVEHLIAVCGNIDLGNDRIKSGAFTKTITEQGLKVRVLDQHRRDTILAALGRPLSLREIGRDELPADVLAEYPEATGAVLARTQFLMDTPEGKGAFIRIAEGAVDEYSFGYDALDTTFETVKIEDKERTVRNLWTLKLWEYGPVLWGMNQATRTLDAKDAGSERKPWDVFPEDDTFCVYRIDEDGERMGSSLACHPTREAANDQLAALYASEEAAADVDPEDKGTPDGAEDAPDGEKEWIEAYPEGYPKQRLGDVLQGLIHKTFTMCCDSWLVEGVLTRDERIGLSHAIGQALDVLTEGIAPDIADRPIYWYSTMSARPPSETRAGLKSSTDGRAGPDGHPPTFPTLEQIQAEMREIEFLEAGS